MVVVWTLLFACAEPVESVETPKESQDCATWYADLDSDGYGDSTKEVPSCGPLLGHSEQPGDCNDQDATIHPTAVDPPRDGVDQNCDGADDCSGATHVESVGEIDCASSAIYVITRSATSLPEGDCVCAVEGDLSLQSSEGAGLLISVSGELKVNPSSKVELPMLERAGELSASLEQFGLAAPRLGSVGDLTLELWDTTPELETLDSFEDGFVRIWGEAVPGLPAKLTAERMVLVGLSQDADLREWTVGYLELGMLGHGTIDQPDSRRVYIPDAPIMLLSSMGWVRTEIEAPAELDTVNIFLLYGGSVHGLTYAKALQLSGGGVELPDLESVEELTLRGDRDGDPDYFELPALTWVEQLVVEDWSPQVRWPNLLEVSEVRLYQSVELPTIERVDVLIDEAGSALTSLVEVGSVECMDTELPVLKEADYASGRCLAPSLETLGDGEGLEGCPECLPRLQYVTGDLTVTGGDVALPELVRTDGTLTLDGVGSFWAPELSSVSGVLVTGTGNTILENSFPGNVRVEDWAPTEAVTWAEVQGSLTMLGTNKVQTAPALTVEHVTANLYMNAPMWRSLEGMSVEEIDGNARWCLKWIANETVLDWLTDTDIGGVAEEECAE